MNVQRFRERSRGGARSAASTSRSVTAHDKLAALKDGLLYIDSASAPSSVAPDGRVSGQVKIVNDAQSIFMDPDQCPGREGYEYNLYITAEWGAEEERREECIGASLIGASTRYHEYDFKAPSAPDSYNISYTIEVTGTLDRDSTTNTIVVEGDSDPDPDPDGCEGNWQCDGDWVCKDNTCVPPEDDDGGGNGGGGGGALLPCILDPNQTCAPGQQTLYAIVGVLLMVVVLSAV